MVLPIITRKIKIIIIVTTSIILGIIIYYFGFSSYTNKDFQIPESFLQTNLDITKTNGEKDFSQYLDILDQNSKTYMGYFESNGYARLKNSVPLSDTEYKKYKNKAHEIQLSLGWGDDNMSLLSWYTSRYDAFIEKYKNDPTKMEQFYKEIEAKNVSIKDILIYKNIYSKKLQIIQEEVKNDFDKDLLKKYENFIETVLIPQQKKIVSSDIIYKIDFSSISNLLGFGKGLLYISDFEMKEGNEEKAIGYLTQNQEFINGVMQKGDLNLIGGTVGFITTNRDNLTSIKYILKNFKLSTESKEKIKKVLVPINKTFLDNGIKNNKLEFYQFIKDFADEKIFLIKFIYSDNETLLLSKKIAFDTLQNSGKADVSFIRLNINNLLGRYLLKSSNGDYSSYYKKLSDLQILQKEIGDLCN